MPSTDLKIVDEVEHSWGAIAWERILADHHGADMKGEERGHHRIQRRPGCASACNAWVATWSDGIGRPEETERIENSTNEFNAFVSR
jgi:hypothetical protein